MSDGNGTTNYAKYQAEFTRRYDEYIGAGQLPKHAAGGVDLDAVERFMRLLAKPVDRVALLKRVLEAGRR